MNKKSKISNPKSQIFSSRLKIKDAGKIYMAFVFFVGAVVSVYFFWKKTVFLFALLVIISFLKHRVIPIKRESDIFVISGLIGSLGESFIITGGAWSYANYQLLNFPIWLPLLWGIAGITGISMYEGLLEKL